MVDLRDLNPEKSTEFIITHDGHFAYGNQKPVRFLGTNMVYASAFPPNDVAVNLARKFAQMGINVVRFHHLDQHDIWADADRTIIDETKLNQLRFFIHQLSLNGIYTNLNLHDSRTYPSVHFLSDLQKHFPSGKILDRFYPEFIQLQKDYAKSLLSSTNAEYPTPLAHDPAVAFLELNNDNSIFDITSKYKYLLSVCEDTGECTILNNLKDQWHSYLKDNFDSFADLKSALDIDHFDWNAGFAFTPYHAINADVSFDGEYWHWEINGDPDEEWNRQMMSFYAPDYFRANEEFRVKFRAKSSAPHKIQVVIKSTVDHSIMFTEIKSIEIGTEFAEYTVTLKITKNTHLLGHDSTICFTIGKTASSKHQIWLGRPSFSIVGGIKIAEQNSLETVYVPYGNQHVVLMSQFRLFLDHTERATQTELQNYIRDELGSKALIADSQSHNANLLSLRRESELSDFIDVHAGWDHPQFDEGHAWSQSYFTITNSALVDSLSAENLTSPKVAGKPYTQSAFFDAFPNEHLHEMFPMLSAWGAYHDWDAIYQYDYHSRDMTTIGQGEPINDYFEFGTNPIFHILTPFAALAFRNRDINAAAQTQNFTFAPQYLLDRNFQVPTTYYNDPSFITDYKKFCHILHEISFTGAENGVQNDPCANLQTEDGFHSEQITWSDGIFSAIGQKVKTVSGHLSGTYDMGRFQVTPSDLESPTNTATIALASLDDRPIETSGRLLFAVVGRCRNTNQQWNEARNTTRSGWGTGPVEVEVIGFTLQIRSRVKPEVHALNPDGESLGPVVVTPVREGWWELESDQRTVWYLVSAVEPTFAFTAEWNTFLSSLMTYVIVSLCGFVLFAIQGPHQ